MINTEKKINKVKVALLAMQRHSWEQGTSMQAFLEQGDMEIVIAMAKEAAYRRLNDGRLANIGDAHAVTDHCAVGEALIAAHKITGDPALKEGIDVLLEWALKKAPRNPDGVLYHVDNAPQIWSDSTFMLPPFLAAAACYEEALLNFYGFWNILFDEHAKLMSHIFDDNVKTFVRKAHWGGGIGWTLASIARLVDLLPDKYANDREKLKSMGKTMLDSLLSCMRSDYFFHDVVDDEKTFVETNLSQMTSYMIFRAVKSNWLDSSYLKTAEKMYEAAEAKIDSFGLVKDCCGAPFFDRPGVSPEGQAFFLLMDAARSKLQQ